MICETHISLIQQLVTLQAARRRNWLSPAEPVDQGIEDEHQKQISQIQEQLSADRQGAVGTSETPARLLT